MRRPSKNFRSVNPNPTVFNLKRQPNVTSQVRYDEKTIIYGEDDSLPLRIAKTVQQSPATTACLRVISDFMKGSHFSDKSLMNIKINKYGTTLWDLHSQLCDSYSLFQGFAVNHKYNIEGIITGAYIMPFENVRLTKADDRGLIEWVKYNPYFGTQEYKKSMTESYPVYDKEKVLLQIDEMGAEFPGQVYYYGSTRPLQRFYPVPDYWSAEFWINIDAKIQEFHKNNLENGFFQSVLMTMYGDPSQPSSNPEYQKKDENGEIISTKTIGEEFNEKMSEQFSGSEKAGNVLTMWYLNPDAVPKIQAFPNTNNSDLFTTLQNLTTKNITIATNVPAILANIHEGVSLGSDGNTIQQAIRLMQSRVVDQQNKLLDYYNNVLLPGMGIDKKVEIVKYTPVEEPVDVADKFWDILTDDEKRLYIQKNISGIQLITPVTPVNPNTQPVISTDVNENLKNLTARQLQQIQRIVKKYNKEELTFEQAKQLLKSGFAFSDDDVDTWLITPEEDE